MSHDEFRYEEQQHFNFYIHAFVVILYHYLFYTRPHRKRLVLIFTTFTQKFPYNTDVQIVSDTRNELLRTHVLSIQRLKHGVTVTKMLISLCKNRQKTILWSLFLEHGIMAHIPWPLSQSNPSNCIIQ